MVRWCIRLTRLTLICEVIRYRLVQVRQNHTKKDFSGWRPAIAFLYLFLFHSLLRLTFFPSQYKNEFIFVKRRSSLVCSSLVRSSLFCLTSIFAFMNMSDLTLVVCEKFSQEFNFVKNCSDESDEIKFLTKISCYTVLMASIH